MTGDKKSLYAASLLLPIVLLLLLVPWGSGKLIAAAVTVLSSVIVSFFIKKRSIASINKGQVLLILSVTGVLFLILYYLSGLYFGFSKTAEQFSFPTFYNYILPISAIIVSIEIIRNVLLSQESSAASVSAYFIGMISEIIIGINLFHITNLVRFMDVVGLTLFPAIAANLLYNYLSKRYGKYPNIVFRLITSLFTYIIPVIPAIPDALLSFARLLLPLLVYIFIDILYEKKTRHARRKKNRLGAIFTCLATLVMISIVMLISCQFRFCAIVIGSESMTGAINKGDAIVYERYDGQIVDVGDVIVFDKDGTITVHRVVDIERINNNNRYYTKGDYNKTSDYGYITDANIIGITNFKISYIGYPTIWLNDLFTKR